MKERVKKKERERETVLQKERKERVRERESERARTADPAGVYLAVEDRGFRHKHLLRD